MKIIEIIPLLLQLFWAIISAFFKAFIQLSELCSIKERIIALVLGIPFQVVAVASFVASTIVVTGKIIKKSNIF